MKVFELWARVCPAMFSLISFTFKAAFFNLCSFHSIIYCNFKIIAFLGRVEVPFEMDAGESVSTLLVTNF